MMMMKVYVVWGSRFRGGGSGLCFDIIKWLLRCIVHLAYSGDRLWWQCIEEIELLMLRNCEGRDGEAIGNTSDCQKV